MELDDQLAALAAGELDDDTARALRARAAADPALARRLARHERLETLLTGWEAPPLSGEAVARLDARLGDALAELEDGPLADRAAATGPIAASVPAAAADGNGGVARPDGVVDLGAARRRRDERRGLPAWLPGATVAAALLAVVGTGVLAGGGLLGSSDEAADDTLADAPAVETAEDTDEEMLDEGSGATGMTESDMASDDAAADEEMADEEMAEESAALAPAARTGVEVAEGDLLSLLDDTPAATDDTADDDEQADGGDAAATCVGEALERDTTQAEGREVWQLATGRYADRAATFVIVRTPSDQPGDRYEVLAYDPGDCSLLARDETVR